METELLIINQQDYKDSNNKQKQYYIDEIGRLKVTIDDCNYAINEYEQNIVKLDASNLAIDATIAILNTN